MEESYIKGKVNRVLFERDGFMIVNITVDSSSDALFEEKKEVGVKGNMAVMEGGRYTFYGKMVQSPKYGVQLSVTRYEKEKPSSKEALVAFLSGAHFPGVGRATAEQVYHALGHNLIQKISENPEVLDQVAHLSAKRKETIITGIRENFGADYTVAQLIEDGFPMNLATEICQKYGEETLEKVRQISYDLIFEFPRLTFRMIDTIAQQQYEIAYDDPKRLKVGLIYMLNEHCYHSGDTYCQKEALIQKTQQYLSSGPLIDTEKIEAAMTQLMEERKLVGHHDAIFLHEMDEAEATISEHIAILMEDHSMPYDQEEVEEVIEEIEEDENITYGASQKQAIINAMLSPFFVLTGGPGTGKTTVVKALIKVYARLNGLSSKELYGEKGEEVIHLAAPTGRAAKRMMEATEMKASTIHRLLGLGIEDDLYGAVHTIDSGLLIVDEFSMVDTFLAATLFEAIGSDVHVIIVGDKDQLPSVRPGNVLGDLLEIPDLPSGELVDIYRQGKDSSIIQLAHSVSQGTLPANFLEKKKDYSFFKTDGSHLQSSIEKIMRLFASRDYQAEDLQVLAPKYKGPGGIDALNKMIQALLNPPSPHKSEITLSKQNDDICYRQGDKVLFLVNDAQQNVFNGDMGFITDIIPAKAVDNHDKVDKMVIDFDGNQIELLRSDWSNITHAYCCSIHKSQGSEFPIVIMPMLSEYGIMLQRNLLYTGITRAKKGLVLLGDPNAFLTAAQRQANKRQTGLEMRLSVRLHGEEIASSTEVSEAAMAYSTDYRLTNELVEEGLIDPMINMGELTPYDFMD